jgi:hypothetical protein
MYHWQKELIKKMAQYKGRGFTQITGRNTGKSTFSAKAFLRLWEDIHTRPIQDLVLSEGKVYGSRYYCVEPVGGNWLEMEQWSLEHFGSVGDHIWGNEKAPEPAQRWYMNNRKFWFRDEMDRTIFVLKWR